MSDYPLLQLKPGKLESIQRRHPWIFSGALKPHTHTLQEGDSVWVADPSGKIIATGHYGAGSIAVRVLDFAKAKADETLYTKKIQTAYALREILGLADAPDTNAYRLVHGEGDGLPGLVIDIYHNAAVVQIHSAGMHRHFEYISSALRACLGNKLEHIIAKSAERNTPNSTITEGLPDKALIKENGYTFVANWATGQKTGFFLDQRDNRAQLGSYANGRKVLNAFCYTGGFSIYALAAGAAEVHSLDSSEKALDLLGEHLQLNGSPVDKHQTIKADALNYLASDEARRAGYDLIVLDPPAFAKHRSARHAAVQAYKRINAKAMDILKPGGLLFTFSCSQVVSPELFNHTIAAAAIECGRESRILHRLQQPADHPVSIFHPEGEYLKGLVVQVL